MAEISIGVPVHNGSELLAESLECLRSQTYSDFEVIVSDNASTDDSLAIAEDYAARDHRFGVIRQPENAGALGNFVATLETATAPYFMWRAHDDLSDANYLEVLHRLLCETPEAVLAVGTVASADLDGGRPRRREFPGHLKRVSMPNRIRSLFSAHPSWVYGLWRTDYLREAFPRVVDAFPHAWAQDHLLLFPVLLRGAIAGTDGTTFRQRIRRTRAGKAKRRNNRLPLELLLAQRRAFREACLAELDQLEGLPALERLMIRALLPLYVNKRVHRISKVIRGYFVGSAARQGGS